VLKAAHSAQTLKADAMGFARVVQSVETCCQQVALKGGLEKSEDAVARLRGALEDGLAHCHKLRSQPFAKGVLLSGRDTQRFAAIRDELHSAMQLLTMATSISTHALVAEKFEQGNQLKAKLEELGGPDAVARDPAKIAAAREFLGESDALLLAAMSDVKGAVLQERQALEQALTHKLDLQETQMAAQHSVMSDQISKLTTMLAAVVDFKAAGVAAEKGEDEGDGEGEDREPPPGIVEAKDVRELMEATPLPANEAARQVAAAECGLTDAEAGALVGGEYQQIVDEFTEEFGTSGGWISAMTEHLQVRQTTESSALRGVFDLFSARDIILFLVYALQYRWLPNFNTNGVVSGIG
jgi:hypothetical protein